jgi:hypothetical protein
MRLADRPCQTVVRLRDRNQMHVVGHQALRPDLDVPLAAPLGHQFQIRLIVVVVEKRLLPTISTLGHMVRQTRHNQSGQSGHASNVEHLTQFVNIGSCPRPPPKLGQAQFLVGAQGSVRHETIIR